MFNVPPDRPLFVCYVDFTKAFDMVRREEMVSRARQLGMEGKFLEALERWFSNTFLQVEINVYRVVRHSSSRAQQAPSGVATGWASCASV